MLCNKLKLNLNSKKQIAKFKYQITKIKKLIYHIDR